MSHWPGCRAMLMSLRGETSRDAALHPATLHSTNTCNNPLPRRLRSHGVLTTTCLASHCLLNGVFASCGCLPSIMVPAPAPYSSVRNAGAELSDAPTFHPPPPQRPNGLDVRSYLQRLLSSSWDCRTAERRTEKLQGMDYSMPTRRGGKASLAGSACGIFFVSPSVHLSLSFHLADASDRANIANI
jgi:hypothetical protein